MATASTGPRPRTGIIVRVRLRVCEWDAIESAFLKVNYLRQDVNHSLSRWRHKMLHVIIYIRRHNVHKPDHLWLWSGPTKQIHCVINIHNIPVCVSHLVALVEPHHSLRPGVRSTTTCGELTRNNVHMCTNHLCLSHDLKSLIRPVMNTTTGGYLKFTGSGDWKVGVSSTPWSEDQNMWISRL